MVIINRYVCDIGYEAAGRIALNTLALVDGLLQGSASFTTQLLPHSLEAVDVLAANGEAATYPVFGDAEFVKAQVKNAWAAVNVGTADFQVFSPSTIEICQGQTLELSATSEVASISILDPNGTELPLTFNGTTATVTIEDIVEENFGTYQIVATYHHATLGDNYCTLTHDVEVTVKHLVIDEGGVIVPDGAELIINNAAVISFADENSGIHVAKGGILRIEDGATLQNHNCSGTYWRGISVSGDWDISHPADFYDNGSAEHGLVVMENSTIKNARQGIAAMSNFNINMGGGIIYAKNNVFENNMISLLFGKFYANQRSVVSGNIFENSATFIVPDPTNLVTTYANVVLIRSNAVKIEHNTFRTIGTELTMEQKGRGIVAYNSDTDMIKYQTTHK